MINSAINSFDVELTAMTFFSGVWQAEIDAKGEGVLSVFSPKLLDFLSSNL